VLSSRNRSVLFICLVALALAGVSRQGFAETSSTAALEDQQAEAEALAADPAPDSRRAAIARFREVIAQSETGPATTVAARSREALAAIVDDHNERITLLEQAMTLRETAGDPAAAARDLVKIGAAQGYLGRKEQALVTLGDALQRLQRLRDAAGEAEARNGLGIVYYWMARYDDARAEHEQALALFEAAADADAVGRTLNFIARAHSRKGRDRRALELYQRAYDVAAALADPRKRSLAEGSALANMANTYLDLGEAERAAPLLEDAAGRVESSPNVELPAVLALRAKARMILGEPGRALDDLARARALHREAGYPAREANVVRQLGDVHGDLGDWEKALAHHKQSLDMLRALGERQGEGHVLYRIGDDLAALGRWSEAAAPLREGLAIARAAGDRTLEANLLTALGGVERSLGETDAALVSLTSALALHRAAGAPRGEAAVHASLGRLHADARREEAASEHLTRALELRRATGHRAGEAQALYDLAALHRRQGQLPDARRRAFEALDIVESLRGTVTSDTLRASFLASKQDHYDLLIDVLMRLHAAEPAKDHLSVALSVSERARARSLLDTLRERGVDVREGVEASLLAREGELRARLNASAGIHERVDRSLLNASNDVRRRLRARHARLERSAAGKEVEAVTKEIAVLLDEYHEVQRRIRAASPRYAALTEPQPARPEEIQRELLDEETTLLEYFLGSRRSVLWLVTRGTIAAFDLPPRAEVEDAARRFLVLLNAREKEVAFETEGERTRRIAEAERQLPEAARVLSEVVLGPVAGRLTTRRLLIVADGALHYVPFAALPLPGRRDDTLLLAEHEVVHAPSASVLLELRREAAPRTPATKTIAVLADPVFGDAYPRLPHTRLEARNILALVPKNQSFRALGLDASRGTVTSAALADYRIVHLATHAFADTERPELSGLVLSLRNAGGEAEDGVLRLHDIYGLELGADLVVLSACQTALGKEIRGEGVVGLTRGFMYAGARTVVASLWSSPDVATSELMTRFYRHLLKEDRAPSDALRAAQLSLARTARWRSPYYWAGFIVQGDWR
jgi:CHAT domain-containing protein/tetratricopeptide (TPR) repeat protein